MAVSVEFRVPLRGLISCSCSAAFYGLRREGYKNYPHSYWTATGLASYILVGARLYGEKLKVRLLQNTFSVCNCDGSVITYYCHSSI